MKPKPESLVLIDCRDGKRLRVGETKRMVRRIIKGHMPGQRPAVDEVMGEEQTWLDIEKVEVFNGANARVTMSFRSRGGLGGDIPKQTRSLVLPIYYGHEVAPTDPVVIIPD